MASEAQTEERTTWYVVAISAAGVEVEGTRQDANDTLNMLTATIETAYKELGIGYKRREQLVIRKPAPDAEDDELANAPQLSL